MKIRADGAALDRPPLEPASRQQTQQGKAATGPRQLQQREQLAQLKQATPASNKTGLPDSLRSGIETLSGMDMSGVRVHRNSSKPAALQAHAYAQGSDIHLAPGQEKHLPHEAWHVVQQAQGRVRPTAQLAGTTKINDDIGLEREADRMGTHALRLDGGMPPAAAQTPAAPRDGAPLVQRKIGFEFQMLDSKVGLFDNTADDNLINGAPSSQHSSVILNSLTDAPKFVVDGMAWDAGANAEYATTQQYDNPDVAKAAVTLIAQHAQAHLAAKAVHAVDGHKLFVWTPDNKGQPQLNVDVSFGKIGREETLRGKKSTDINKDPYVGINGRFGWSGTKTALYLQQREAVKTAMDQRWNDLDALRRDVINYQGGPIPDLQLAAVPNNVVTSLRPLAQAAAMTYVSGLMPHSTTLGKDVPILPKIDVSSVVGHMGTLLTSRVGGDYTLNWPGLESAADNLMQQVGIANTVSRFEPSGTAPPTSIGGADAVPVDLARQTAVMEYRRAREVPIKQWPKFAADAVTNFQGLDQP